MRRPARLGWDSPDLALASEPGRWERLMAQAQAGDRAAYATLLTELLPVLRGLAGTTEAAEREARVQAMLRVIHALRHVYDPARPLLPWVAGIGRRCAMERPGGLAARFRRRG
ncbi:hypothetical protein [Paracraurococcus ruber]|nr:hypothetical protein [Paracraurococcus ruber]